MAGCYDRGPGQVHAHPARHDRHALPERGGLHRDVPGLRPGADLPERPHRDPGGGRRQHRRHPQSPRPARARGPPDPSDRQPGPRPGRGPQPHPSRGQGRGPRPDGRSLRVRARLRREVRGSARADGSRQRGRRPALPGPHAVREGGVRRPSQPSGRGRSRLPQPRQGGLRGHRLPGRLQAERLRSHRPVGSWRHHQRGRRAQPAPRGRGRADLPQPRHRRPLRPAWLTGSARAPVLPLRSRPGPNPAQAPALPHAPSGPAVPGNCRGPRPRDRPALDERGSLRWRTLGARRQRGSNSRRAESGPGRVGRVAAILPTVVLSTASASASGSSATASPRTGGKAREPRPDAPARKARPAAWKPRAGCPKGRRAVSRGAGGAAQVRSGRCPGAEAWRVREPRPPRQPRCRFPLRSRSRGTLRSRWS